MTKPHLTFSHPSARLQYILLMGLFRLAITRGLYGRFARSLGRLFPETNRVQVQSPTSAPFCVSLNDGYWTRFLLYHGNYEPEVANILAAAAGHATLFCDLGANTGYWTTRAAPRFGQIIAVEASTPTFAELTDNTTSLPNVICYHAAIFSQAGQNINFINVHNSHASSRVESNNTSTLNGHIESITTVTIDDLIQPGVAALIKLDVEGMEIPALTGGTRALRDGAVVIYEDHGNDPDCAPSAFLLDQPDMQVFSIEQGIHQIHSVNDIRQLKTDPFKGYNFLAARKGSVLLCSILENHQSPVKRPMDQTQNQRH